MASDVSVEKEAIMALFRAAGRLRHRFGALFEGHDLTLSQYNVLRILRGARGHLPIMTIRDRMMDPEPSITRLVDRLEGKGLVRRERSADDRRCVECVITPEGSALLEALEETVDALDREVTGQLTGGQLSTLVRMLDQVGVVAS